MAWSGGSCLSQPAESPVAAHTPRNQVSPRPCLVTAQAPAPALEGQQTTDLSPPPTLRAAFPGARSKGWISGKGLSGPISPPKPHGLYPVSLSHSVQMSPPRGAWVAKSAGRLSSAQVIVYHLSSQQNQEIKAVCSLLPLTNGRG